MVAKGADLGDAMRCRECGAVNAPGATRCWICGRIDWERIPLLDAAKSQGAASTDVASVGGRQSETIGVPGGADRRSSIATIMLVIGIIAVVIGLMKEAPGFGILFCVSVLPAFIVLTVLAQRRQKKNRPMSTAEKVAIFVALTIFIPIVLAVTFFVLLWIVCAVERGAIEFSFRMGHFGGEGWS